MTVPPSPAELAILSEITSDSYGLWEIASLLAVESLDSDCRGEEAQKVLLEMLEKNWIQVLSQDDFAGEEYPVAETEARSLLSMSQSYALPEDDNIVRYRVWATVLGREAYRTKST